MNILITIPEKEYAAKIIGLIKDTANNANKVLYISLNKTYKSLVNMFFLESIDIDKFYFIDGITATFIETKQQPKCRYLDSVKDLDKVYDTIISMIQENIIDSVVFDSISSLTIYQDKELIVGFISKLLGTLSEFDCSAVFTLMKCDEDSDLANQIKMKVDKNYELS